MLACTSDTVRVCMCVKMKRECRAKSKYEKGQSHSTIKREITEQEEAHFVSRVTVTLTREKERIDQRTLHNVTVYRGLGN